ncbi:MAG: DNA translocase FtsK, partial [Proteobacteria bacterium]|nr:DNA translocase FtsK [Pseudomonadota bacterium]
MRRRLFEATGFALIVLTGVVALALASWSVGDPSLSHATGAPPRNLLGYPGAIVADLLMQLFGLAAIALILPLTFWGWRLFGHRGLDRHGIRVMIWFVATALAAGFASCLPKSAKWPLPTGLGGVVGDALLRLPAAVLGGALNGVNRWSLAFVLGVAAVAALAVASGFGFKLPGIAAERRSEPARADAADGDESASISIGWLIHAVLSLKARMLRFLAGWFAARRPRPNEIPLSTRRVAPTFDLHAGGAATDADADLVDIDDDAADIAVAPKARKPLRPARAATRKSADGYALPALNLLTAPRASDRSAPSLEAIQENAVALESVLQDFGVRGEIINARPGPVVTLYELEPAPGIKSSRVIGLADDIARSMSALSARVAVVSGRNAIGVELPNATREKVLLRELLASEDYNNSAAKLPLCLGKTIGGEAVIVDLARMPHLLIAGTTGSGKSVAINTMILSLVYRLTPDQCRLIMVDPKMLELSVYDGIPHLLTPVVTDPKKAVVALKWAVREMEERYRKMSKLGVRGVEAFNERVRKAKDKGE